ncbi:MAG TPA: hypothetical protein VFZ22_10575 [Pyrinomonadaceae bacterium]|nr:hypothetical protein [Pyrinomonadaceae bacterium]
MSGANGIELPDLIANIAVDSINTQVRFNAAHEIALKEFAALLAGVTDPSLRALLMAAVPARMHVDTFEVSVGVALTKETEFGFSISALPLGVGFSILHAVRTDRSSRIAVTVQQVPLEHAV